jgi:uncharacterized membrane protein YraQ (UPF0718 family)
MNWLWMSLYHALAMLWMTFWALVLGFGISAALQVFVSKEQMARAFGRVGFREVWLATLFGAASSSCSYAATAAARSAFQQDAALIPALAFMFASTNLVIELGAVLWLLMGWKFVLAEVIGSFVLIGVMWLLMMLFFSKDEEEEARRQAQAITKNEDHSCHAEHPPSQGSGSAGDHKHEIKGEGKWTRVARAFVMDWRMLWKEILGGFLIAGFLAALVPSTWWKALFLETGPAPLRLIENALVGPLIAVASFVCSVGNIPLASLLWSNGISFGGVISFIYADLIIIPLIVIYVKYYGTRAAAKITLILYASMVVAGIIVDLLFSALGLIPQGPRPESAISHALITWNYTSWFDLSALVVGGFLLFLYLRDRDSGEMHHAHH